MLKPQGFSKLTAVCVHAARSFGTPLQAMHTYGIAAVCPIITCKDIRYVVFMVHPPLDNTCHAHVHLIRDESWCHARTPHHRCRWAPAAPKGQKACLCPPHPSRSKSGGDRGPQLYAECPRVLKLCPCLPASTSEGTQVISYLLAQQPGRHQGTNACHSPSGKCLAAALD